MAWYPEVYGVADEYIMEGLTDGLDPYDLGPSDTFIRCLREVAQESQSLDAALGALEVE